MSKPSPPPPPDYTGAAQAQGAANVDAARVSGQMNNPNVNSPYGTQTVTYNGDVPTLTQTFSPEQQALYNQQTSNQQQLGNLSSQGINAAQGIVGTKLDLNGLPPPPGAPGQIRSDVVNAMMARPTEDYNRAVDQKQSSLVAAGIHGGKAYDDQMNLLNRGLNDARNQATIAGTQAAGQDYSQTMQSRQQALTEALAQRQTPLNEITALMSGSQVSNPFSMPNYAQNSQVAPAPIFAATDAAGNYQTDLYNQKMGMYGNTMNGLFGLAGAGLQAAGAAAGGAKSDRRLKTNVRKIGMHASGVSAYEYDIEGRRERGVMADELLAVRPDAVSMGHDGYWRVHYDMIGGRPSL